MKSLSNWQHLEPYGIIFLTGEACGLQFRLLFDVTDKGRKLLSKAFGVPQLALAEPWNSGSDRNPHVGSILLPQSLFPTLAIFALLENGFRECWLCKNGTVLGFETSDTQDDVDQTARLLKDDVVRRFAYRGTAKDRNVHLMTGRTA